jgi:hypothetical protein
VALSANSAAVAGSWDTAPAAALPAVMGIAGMAEAAAAAAVVVVLVGSGHTVMDTCSSQSSFSHLNVLHLFQKKSTYFGCISYLVIRYEFCSCRKYILYLK